ncbi:hypothetical protein BJ878DRAFT_501590 [Calycina marina]|uniref:Copper acquisition factor BIM1-like domain-containing protein n=1 Tax=Calycina marina TaxID=1763456 RepID=A0A9P7Z533_9HELO|nr:hypothetical protein BJ878DRAFT_501590 [Calycina marina]
MFSATILSVLGSVALVAGHFTITYPEMRGDSFATGASQYIYPCANVNQTAETNRTEWPLTGGSIALDLGHAWTYAFINVGLGTDYPVTNYSLTNDRPLNITGKGDLCMEKLDLPAGLTVTDGQNATIQVVTVGETGTALYNCADIIFKTSATVLSSDDCPSNSNITTATVEEVSTNETSSTNSTADATTTTTTSGAVGTTSSLATAGFVGVAAVVIGWLL